MKIYILPIPCQNVSRYVDIMHNVSSSVCFYSSKMHTSRTRHYHCSNVIMSAVAPQLFARAFFFQAQIKENIKVLSHWHILRGVHRWLQASPHKGPVTRKMFSFDGVTMYWNYPHPNLNDALADLSLLKRPQERILLNRLIHASKRGPSCKILIDGFVACLSVGCMNKVFNNGQEGSSRKEKALFNFVL